MRNVGEDRMIYYTFCLNILIGLLLHTRNIYGQVTNVTINVPAVGNYGEETYMNCTEANFDITKGYTWLKDNSLIYNNVNGDATSTGKYSSTHGTGFFTLTVANTALDDAGVYVCDYDFDPKSGTLAIQAKGTVTAELSSSSSGKLEVTFQKIYPNTTTVVVKCDSIIENGAFISDETDGDGFTTKKWESEKNFTSVPSDCSVIVTLLSTFTVPFVVKSAPTVDIYDCPGLGNSTAVDSEGECVCAWIGIGFAILLVLFLIGIVLGCILICARCCCDCFYDGESCRKCVDHNCCRCECCPKPCRAFCNITGLPPWYRGLCASVIGILVAFGIWVVWKCSNKKSNPPGGHAQPDHAQPLQDRPVNFN